MASTFDRWEKDPFFSAAEEVQESADRMESIYRTWIHAKKGSYGVWDLNELRRDLQTTLGTTKWQLDDFECAVKSSYASCSSADDAKDRHRDFITAIANQTSNVENSLKESSFSHDKMQLPWLRLDEGERNELALFLSGSALSPTNKTFLKVHDKDVGVGKLQRGDQQLMTECSRPPSLLVGWGRGEAKEEKFSGHRRTASASADFRSWKIEVLDALHYDSSNAQPDSPPRKNPSFSGFLNTMESSICQLKWPKNAYKKLKLIDRRLETDTTLPSSQNLTRETKICYEKNKSCIDGCDDYYNRQQLYGWYGAMQRQFQRSQYHMQYSRPVQIVLSIILLICLLVMLASRAF